MAEIALLAAVLAAALGLSAVLQVLGGRQADVLLQRILGRLVSMRASREVERRAGETALRILEAAGIDPGALADALGRLERERLEQRGVLQYLASHPDLQARIEGARAFSREAAARRAAPWVPLDSGVWLLLRGAL